MHRGAANNFHRSARWPNVWPCSNVAQIVEPEALRQSGLTLAAAGASTQELMHRIGHSTRRIGQPIRLVRLTDQTNPFDVRAPSRHRVVLACAPTPDVSECHKPAYSSSCQLPLTSRCELIHHQEGLPQMIEVSSSR
jgi:hypothetical protein